MKVILQQDIPKVGKKYEVVDVADGYAANFLFPQQLAEVATNAKVAELEKKREAAKAGEDARIEDLREKLDAIQGATVTITTKADDQGHLYKKIHADDIAQALKDEYDVELRHESIHLDAPIHEIGDTEVTIEAADKKVTCTIQVVAE